MDRIRRPSSTDSLGYFLMAVAIPANQLQAVNHGGRGHSFSELQFKLCQIAQNSQEKIRIAEVCNMTSIITTWLPHETRPGGENEDWVQAAFQRNTLELLQKILHSFLGCNHEGPPDVKAVVFLHTATDSVHTAIFVQT
jgi:hypothetical protein